jgi:hypothetical protein
MSKLLSAVKLLRLTSLPACLIALASTAAAANAATPYRGAQVHSLWSSVSRSEMTQELNALQGAGANVLRVDVGWASLETARGQYEPAYLAKLDALAAEAQARGIKLLATLWWTPGWASAGGAWNDAPSNPSDYGNFARFMTARYGTELAAIEAWNEPEINNNLVASNVPLAYAAMVKAFYAGAKQGNPSVAVLAGSLAYADVAFLGQLYLYGIKGSYDALSVHPYADGAAPENRTVTHSFIGGIEKLHLFQQANGDGTPVWVTEFGWPVGTSPGANTEQQQAEYVEKAFGLLNMLPYVGGATLYQLRDMGTDAANAEDNFGLLHQNFAPRPAYTAFKNAMLAAAGVPSTEPTPTPVQTLPEPATTPVPKPPEPTPTQTKPGRKPKAKASSLATARQRFESAPQLAARIRHRRPASRRARGVRSARRVHGRLPPRPSHT